MLLPLYKGWNNDSKQVICLWPDFPAMQRICCWRILLHTVMKKAARSIQAASYGSI